MKPKSMQQAFDEIIDLYTKILSAYADYHLKSGSDLKNVGEAKQAYAVALKKLYEPNKVPGVFLTAITPLEGIGASTGTNQMTIDSVIEESSFAKITGNIGSVVQRLSEDFEYDESLKLPTSNTITVTKQLPTKRMHVDKNSMPRPFFKPAPSFSASGKIALTAGGAILILSAALCATACPLGLIISLAVLGGLLLLGAGMSYMTTGAPTPRMQ